MATFPEIRQASDSARKFSPIKCNVINKGYRDAYSLFCVFPEKALGPFEFLKTQEQVYHIMNKLTVFGIAASLWALSAAPTVGKTAFTADFFLISRNIDGGFIGSHKIFRRHSAGLRKVTYCDRDYWVRPVTVAWTEVEVENKHLVRIEYNIGKGWRPICERPEEQVTLKDLGVAVDARTVLYTNGRELDSINRFSAIRDSFHTGKNRQKTSFHD